MLPAGSRIAQYTIESSIGAGGMGVVYRAVDSRLERRVALKTIHLSDAPDLAARLRREALAAASLNHPNIVSIFDVGETEHLIYCAMELVEGPSLRDLIGQSETPVSEKLRWVVDIARALDVAHRAGLVHRDVKPENVMLRADGVIKVLDFGIARRLRGTGEDMITKRGEVIGTPAYMSPEQLAGETATARADQFSWGVLAYEVLTGSRPWTSKGDILSTITAIVQTAPTPIAERLPELPEVAATSIMRALGRTEDERFASMAEVVRTLEPFVGAVGPAPERVSQVHLSSPIMAAYAATTKLPTEVSNAQAKMGHKPNRRRRIAIGAAVLLASVSFGLGAFFRPTTSTTPATSALCKSPEANTLTQNAVLLFRDGADEKAMRELRRAIEVEPSCPSANLYAVLSLRPDDGLTERFSEAHFAREQLNPRDAALLEAVSPFFSNPPDIRELETRLMRLVDTRSKYAKDAEVHFLLGKAHELAFDYELAATSYARSYELNPNYVRALSAEAAMKRLLGDSKGAHEDSKRCLTSSKVATNCLSLKAKMDLREGRCKEAKEAASQWVSIDSKSVAAEALLARTLYSAHEEKPSINVALEASWSLSSQSNEAVWREQRDRVTLAIQEGDFASAESLLLAWEKAFPRTSSRTMQSAPRLLLAELYEERGEAPKAISVAKTFLAEQAGFPHNSLLPDPAVRFYRFVEKPEDLKRKKQLWLEEEKRSDQRKERERSSGLRWWYMHGESVQTRAQATEAVAAIRDFSPLPVDARREPGFDLALGRAYARAEKYIEAKRELEKLVSGCRSFDHPLEDMHARYELATALQALGETGRAKQLYEEIVTAWGNAKPRSVTAEAAKTRLRSL
jgi:eukaryotic-like serine/threonine-protein kinase